MRLFSLSIFLIFITSTLAAQDYPFQNHLSPLSFKNSEVLLQVSENSVRLQSQTDIDKQLKRARRLKVTGLIFTGLGTLGAAIGTTTLIQNSRNNNLTGIFVNTVYAYSILPPSAIMLGVGIPMTIVGFHKGKKYKKQAVNHAMEL